jgi:hypothetical protein
MLSMSKLAIALAIGIASASIIGGSYLFVKLKAQMRNWHVFTQLSFYSIMVLLKPYLIRAQCLSLRSCRRFIYVGSSPKQP